MFVQMLRASYEFLKYHDDAVETLAQIDEKRRQIPDDLGRDYTSAENFQNKHEIFAQDIKAIGSHVR